MAHAGSKRGKAQGGTMMGTLATAAVVSALFVPAWLVGMPYGAQGSLDEPIVLQLRAYGCTRNDDDPATRCHVYRLKDEKGNRTGEISRFRTPIFDLEGNDVGLEFRSCIYSSGSQAVCTTILALRASPATDRGRIVLSGVPDHAIPITGGSGAYVGVEGEGRAVPNQGSWLVTLSLTS